MPEPEQPKRNPNWSGALQSLHHLRREMEVMEVGIDPATQEPYHLGRMWSQTLDRIEAHVTMLYDDAVRTESLQPAKIVLPDTEEVRKMLAGLNLAPWTEGVKTPNPGSMPFTVPVEGADRQRAGVKEQCPDCGSVDYLPTHQCPPEWTT